MICIFPPLKTYAKADVNRFDYRPSSLFYFFVAQKNKKTFSLRKYSLHICVVFHYRGDGIRHEMIYLNFIYSKELGDAEVAEAPEPA